jgi:hypothetical protein
MRTRGSDEPSKLLEDIVEPILSAPRSEDRSTISILDHNGTLTRIPVSNSPVPQIIPYFDTRRLPIDNTVDVGAERIRTDPLTK